MKKRRSIILGIPLLIGASLMTFGFWLAHLGSTAKTWPVAAGELTDAKLSSTGARRGFYVDAAYTYKVGTNIYSNDLIPFGFSGGKGTDQLIAKSPGDPVPVSYNPMNPEQSVIIPGVSSTVYFLLGMGAAGCFVPLIVFWGLNRRPRTET